MGNFLKGQAETLNFLPFLLGRGRVPFLVVIAGLTAFFGWQCLGLRVDQDNRSMDADDEFQKTVEREFRDQFNEGDSLLVAVKCDDLLEPGGRRLLRELVTHFESLEGVVRVLSIVETGFEIGPGHVGFLISPNRKTAGIRIVFGEFSDNGETLRRLVEDVKEIAASRGNEKVKVAVAGLPVQKYEVGLAVRKDQRLFAPLSLLILGVVLWFTTRRLSGMLYPLLVAVLTICWTLGLYALSGKTLNMITSLLPPVIMTLSVATTIHIYLDWLRSTEPDNRKRILSAVKSLYRPCLFASITTAIGFLSLILSPTPAVRAFGIFAAVGVAIAYFFGVLGIAVGLSFLRPPQLAGSDTWYSHSHAVIRALRAVAKVSIEHPRTVVFSALLLAGIGGLGLMKIKSDTDLLHFLGDDSPLVRETEFMDGEFGGVSTIDLFVKNRKGEALRDLDLLADFGEKVRGLEFVTRSLSLADVLPDPALAALRQGIPLEEILKRAEVPDFINLKRDQFRITIRTESIGTHEGGRLIGRIRETAGEVFGDDYEVSLVGGFYRVVDQSNHLVRTQLISFAVAIVLILLAIGIVFRSFLYTVLAIIPNVVPLLVTAGVMGFGGIALSTGTAMIASVVIGIAVDDTIHYLSAFGKKLSVGVSHAVTRTTMETGFVLFATTLALSAGFWVAIFGSFQPTVYFALLTGITMWFALACDLIVLPACLVLASPILNRKHLPQTLT